MINTIQNIIWNIGGFLFTVTLILFCLAFLIHHITNYLSFWHKKENRTLMLEIYKNRGKIKEYLDKELRL